MDGILPEFSNLALFSALLIGVGAGFVKGVVGFAMPLVMISGLTLFVSPELALAGLILPTLVTNVLQSLRQGRAAAWRSIKSFRVFLVAGGITLVIAAQFVRVVPDDVFKAILGVVVVAFVTLQLSGYRFALQRRTVTSETLVGGFTGMMGGMVGVWAPPTVAYLTALDTSKDDQMRIQGVIYGLGSMALVGAHIGSGVLRNETWPFSAMLVVPAVLGIWLGSKVSDRIDQRTFRRATLIVLLVAGLNLLRRALF